MKKEYLKYWIIISITVLVAVIVYQADRFPPINNDKLFKFPSIIGEWEGKEILMGPEIFASLETPYAILRDYSSSKYPFHVSLSIVWFDDRNIAIHAPEACLGGIGNYVKEKKSANIKLDKEYIVDELITENNGIKQLVIYFYNADGYITTSQSSLRLSVLKNRFQFKRTSISYIRIMAPIIRTEEETMKAVKDFIGSFYPFIPEYTYTDRIMK